MTRRFVFYPFLGNFGGIERLIVDLARWLDSQEATLTWVGFQNDIDFAQFGASNIDCVRLTAPRRPAAETRGLRNWFDSAGIDSSDVLVMEMQGAMYAGAALPPGYALHIADPPRLLGRDVSKHSFSLRRLYPAHQRNVSWMQALRGQWAYRRTRIGIHKAGCAITMTQQNVAELQTAFGRCFDKLPPGVRIPASPVPRSSSDHVRYLSVCRLEPTKRIDRILHAFSKLPGDGRRLTIVGGGSERRSLEQLADQLGVTPRVRFTGEVSECVLEALYAEHDVFVMPAIQGYGLPGLEALARGLSLVVHRDSGVTEFLTDLPQVQIISDSDQSLIEAMRGAVASTADISAEGPQVPTSDGWARSIAEFSGWLQDCNPRQTNRMKTSE